MANEMAIEVLSTTDAWAALSPALREILTAMFAAGDRDLAAAVAKANPHFGSQRAEAIANSMLANAEVQAVLLLQSGQVALSSAPLPGTLDYLFLRDEWRHLEPLKIRLRADDISESGETLDVQRILRLCFTSAREDLRDAVGMYRPDLSQESVALIVKALHETPAVRRVFQLRRGAE